MRARGGGELKPHPCIRHGCVTPKVSVIIPTYNTGKYFEQTTSSVLKQSYGAIELILVDDGSKDGTAEACDRLAEEDERIVVIHQQNAGTSAARNAGIQVATGDYITFLDHDDFWFDRKGLESAMACAESGTIDVIMHHVLRFDDPTQTLDQDDAQQERKREKLAQCVATDGYAQGILDITRAGFMVRAVWAKIVRADLVREHRLLFPEGRRNEDTDWTAALFEVAQSIRWCATQFGAYRVGHGTAQTAKPVNDVIVDGLAEVIDRHACTAQSEKDESLRHALFAYLAYPYVVWLGQSEALGRSVGHPTFEKMRRWAKPIFNAADDPNVKLASLCFKLIGLNMTARALGFAYKRMHPA